MLKLNLEQMLENHALIILSPSNINLCLFILLLFIFIISNSIKHSGQIFAAVQSKVCDYIIQISISAKPEIKAKKMVGG